MNMRRLRLVSSLLLIVLCAAAAPARAGCAGVPVEVRLASDDVAAVFRGRVVDLRLLESPALPGRSGQGQIARFDVDHVWKGDVGAEVVLHFRPVDGPRLMPGGEYVVFAHRLDAFGRYQFNLPVDPAGGADALGANLLHDRPSTTSDLSCAGVLPVNSGTARRLAEAHVGQAPD